MFFYYPYWGSFSQFWSSQDTCADEFVPFVEAGGRRSVGTRRNRRHPIRRRVGWTLVQIGLWLVVRSAEGLPGMQVVPRSQDSGGEMDNIIEE